MNVMIYFLQFSRDRINKILNIILELVTVFVILWHRKKCNNVQY